MYVKRAEFQHGIFRVCLIHSSTWAVFTNLYWFLQLTTVCILPTNSAKAQRSNTVTQCNNNLTQTVQLLYWPVGWFQNRRTMVDVLPTSNIGAASWEFQTVSVTTAAPVSRKNNKQSNINIPFTWHWNKHAKNTILIAFSALTLLVRHQEEHLVCKNWATRCWCGYLSGARCRQFAYGPADATAIPKLHHHLPYLNPDCSGTGLPRLSWKRGN